MKSDNNHIKFSLLEYEISDKDLEYFIKNIEQGCVKRVNQLSLSKWQYLLRYESSLLEIELSYNQNSIKSFSCACGLKSPSRICKHALLVAYWHYQKISNDDLKPGNEIRFGLDAFDECRVEDLRYYLYFLAKVNPFNKQWLNFLLETRSVSQNAFEKYEKVLEKFSSYIDGYTKNLASVTKLKLQMLDELYQISFYHYNMSNAEESIVSLLAGIQYLNKWQTQTAFKNPQKLVQLNERYHIALNQFVISIIAPAAQTKLFKLIRQIADDKDYNVLSSKANLFEILLTKKSNAELQNAIFDRCTAKLKIICKIEFKYNLLDFLYIKFKTRLQDYLLNLPQEQKLNLTLNWIESRIDFIAGDWASKLYLDAFESSTGELKKHCANLLSQIILKNSSGLNNNLLIKFYLQTGDTSFLEKYFNYPVTENIDVSLFLNDLKGLTKNLSLSLNQSLDLAYYSKQWEVLINLLSTVNDLDLISTYDITVPEIYQKRFIEIYIKLCKVFLETHAGFKSHQKMDHLSRHIKRYYRNSNFQHFIRELKILFPERKLALLKQ